MIFQKQTIQTNATNVIVGQWLNTSYRNTYQDSDWFNYRGYEAHQKINNFNKFNHVGYNASTFETLTLTNVRQYIYWNVLFTDREFILPFTSFTKIRLKKQTEPSGRWTLTCFGTKPTNSSSPLDTISLTITSTVTGNSIQYHHYGNYAGSDKVFTLP